ncbi:MAG: cytochrome c oxidase subunit II [Candidatus Kapabacteria bacterium]|nr:cytochrome c oxidase subunit II [Candidatus Kapabacteria bacterium]
MFSGATRHAAEVDGIMFFIVLSSAILLVLITIAMIYFTIRYNKKRNPVATNIEGNTILEVVWIAIPTILVLFMFYYGYVSFADTRSIPKDAMNVKVLGKMWVWSFTYANGKTSDTLYLPSGKAIKLDLLTSDVNHGFFVPAFRIKEDCISGKQNYMVIYPDKTGEYDIFCSEYCGMNHSSMYTKMKVVSESEFNSWLKK